MDYPSAAYIGLHLGKFTDGTADGSVKPSLDPASWSNAVTDELLAVIAAGGLVKDEANTTQVRDAIAEMIAAAVAAAAPNLAGYAQLAITQLWTKAQRGAVVAVASASTFTIDFALANYFTCTAGHNATLALPSNLVPGQSGSIWVVQPAAGGPYTWSFAAEWDFGGGTVPSLSATANAVDRLDYLVRTNTNSH